MENYKYTYENPYSYRFEMLKEIALGAERLIIAGLIAIVLAKGFSILADKQASKLEKDFLITTQSEKYSLRK